MVRVATILILLAAFFMLSSTPWLSGVITLFISILQPQYVWFDSLLLNFFLHSFFGWTFCWCSFFDLIVFEPLYFMIMLIVATHYHFIKVNKNINTTPDTVGKTADV
ncbi:MAG: hypothetical protein ACI9C4_002774 [Paraglaciecola sp.]|jgi:hypothetical protein